MGFANVRGALGTAAGGGATVSVTLGAAPTTGDLVCVAVGAFNGSGAPVLNTVKDGAGNSYTITPNSPAAAQPGAGVFWLAWIVAPAGASATITATFGSTNQPTVSDIWADEFSVTGGSATFDKDIAGSGTSGTTINSPSITPANAGSLLYSGSSSAAGITAPAAGATLGSWTGAAGGIDSNTSWESEYDLSASSATTVDYTQSDGAWGAMAMAFTFTAGGIIAGWQSPTMGPSYAI